MGRISIPCLNKAGYSMFWDSMWDDKHNYSKLINENVFIRICSSLIFEDLSSDYLTVFLKKPNFNEQILSKYNIFFKNFNNIKLYKFLKSEFLFSFLSKTWILRYHGWVVIYIFMYIPSFNNFIITSKNSSEFQSFYYDIFFNYYYNLIKLNSNNSYFNDQVLNKYIF